MKRQYKFEKDVVKFQDGKVWDVYSLILIEDGEVLRSAPIIPYNEEIKRACEFLENAILTFLGRENKKHPSLQLSFTTVAETISRSVREEIPHSVLHFFDTYTRLLREAFPIEDSDEYYPY